MVTIINTCKRLISLTLFLGLAGCATNYAAQPQVQQFINQVSAKDQFSKMQLIEWFSEIKPNKQIIKNMTTPHEAMPWYAYRTIFLQPDRAQEGAAFWQKHAATLAYAQQRYGVPPEIIVAILGVETRYGQWQGKYSAFDAISTLAFDYPPRAKYFRGELEQYLLLTREASFDPLVLKGSYAGALGAAQFMPSSYRHYAVSYTGKSYSDLFHNTDDAIMSIANYFAAHGWQTGGPVAVKTRTIGNGYMRLPPQGLKPDLTLAQFSHYGVYPAKPYSAQQEAALISLTDKSGVERWLGFNNFYVITRYNTSSLYAMAVYQLSEWIRSDYYSANKTAVKT